jgi:hypothetical protein
MDVVYLEISPVTQRKIRAAMARAEAVGRPITKLTNQDHSGRFSRQTVILPYLLPSKFAAARAPSRTT